MRAHRTIPIVDIFAGPGGLGEGFSAYVDSSGRSRFHIAVSIEKETWAHETLRLRAFQRLLGTNAKPEYWDLLAAAAPWEAIAALNPKAGARAEEEAIQLELGIESAARTRQLISEAVGSRDEWVLVGGPPCQAYSLVGRSRNQGNPNYVPEADHRQRLYVEYLQVLADHAPPVFVMENVKGILSATLHNRRLFEQILTDLKNPRQALKTSGRKGRLDPSYRIHALTLPAASEEDLFSSYREPVAEDFVVRAERFGVPQARHRVILLGIRDGAVIPRMLMPAGDTPTVEQAISWLPRLRSGLSKQADSPDEWLSAVRSAGSASWIRKVDASVRGRILKALDETRLPQKGRGADVFTHNGVLVLNHAARSHIESDLHRYLFASAFAQANGASPSLKHFPLELRPAHRNVEQALDGGLFSDRFRVQVRNKPATTITSHISKDGHYYIHYDPTQCRSLTVREAAQLQTFPPDYFFRGPRTAQYQQVGNAVPPRLASQIADVVAGIF